MASGDVVDVPAGRLMKPYRGIAISVQDYDGLFPFLFATVERKFAVGEVSAEFSAKICIGATITENEVFLNFHEPATFEYIEAYINLSRMASSFLDNYKRIPLDGIYRGVNSDENNHV